MTINLHDLINQPGYGKAEKALRAAGKWRVTPEEKLRDALSRISELVDDIECAASDCGIAVQDAINALEGTK